MAFRLDKRPRRAPMTCKPLSESAESLANPNHNPHLVLLRVCLLLQKSKAIDPRNLSTVYAEFLEVGPR